MATVSGFLGGTSGGSIIGGAVVRLYLDDSTFNSALASAESKTKGATTSMGGGMAKFGAIAKAGFIAAGVAAVAFAASSVRAFLEAEKVMAQTEAVIKSTGGAAGYTAQQIADMAKSFEQSTTFSDEAVQSMENVLLTFRAIGHDELPTTTQAVLDMSTALGTDLQSAAIQVGKALQDPTIGLTALRRVGVSFSQSQIALIKNFQDTGQAAKAQEVILNELNTEFGGSASAALDTYGGKWEQLMNKVDDAKEAFAGFFINAIDGPAKMEDATNAVGAALGRDYLNAQTAAEKATEHSKLAYIQFALAEESAAIKAKAMTNEVSNFANMTADELESWQSSATDSMGFVESAFDDLSSAAHVSAKTILRSFEQALNAQQDFARNSDKFLSAVAKSLGPDMEVAAGQMVSALAEKGPEGAALMDALAGASAKMRKQILHDWVASGQGAQSYIGDLSQVDAHLNALDGRQVNIDIITHYIQTGKID